MSPDRYRRPQVNPRLVVLGTLLVSYGWALIFPLRLTRPPSGLLATTYVVGLALFGGALALVLRSAVSPEQSQRTRIALVGVLVVVTLALWPPAYAWAVPGQEPWAWVSGFAIGACALAVPRAGAVVAVGLGAMAAAGAVVFDGSVVKSLGFSLGSAAVVWLTGLVLVWLLGLVWAAEAGREAEADLVLAQERLRVSRELHDVLGHRLGIIALKAELAADLAATDPARSAAESGEIREIAAATLAEARRAVHGETVADLATQIASARSRRAHCGPLAVDPAGSGGAGDRAGEPAHPGGRTRGVPLAWHGPQLPCDDHSKVGGWIASGGVPDRPGKRMDLMCPVDSGQVPRSAFGSDLEVKEWAVRLWV